MKKLLLLALVAAGLAGMMQSCKPDAPDGGSTGASLTVAKKQRSLVVYHTATWCGPCGLYAMPEFKKLVAANDIDNIVPVDYHFSNSSRLVPLWMKPNNDTLFIAPFAGQLLTTFSNINAAGQYSVPSFWLNNSLIGQSTIKVTDIQSSASQANSYPVEIGVAASASASGLTLSIKYKLKAFAPEAGSDYYVSAFIVEKSVTALQTVSGSGEVSTAHERVIRASAISNAAGMPVAFSPAAVMTSPAANAEVEKTISWTYTAIPDAVKAKFVGWPWWNWNPSNTGVVIAVWRKVTDPVKPYYLVNTVYADVK
jgi:thiol-disulfide isomerase/thioredoxin